ncbi:Putative glycosyl transferase [Planktothrix tepida]|uniref:Glycosyl transferase n=2 Tax=Planktothrix TaxID=54304 RepID=A0A9W4GA17_9CYAN|nr:MULTISPECIES: glycosyltransferase family 2 protein [Planktothrix]CAD5919068.1 Putative glycosyl transferase [Planktothrix tepida]CAD5984208.1 Putative glycosyl transferase [Planktothrix pseudagardhii]CUR30830.1 putative glycosyl transferase [Planktothrix tepida PCC 9214]
MSLATQLIIGLTIIAVALGIPVSVFFLECLAALMQKHSSLQDGESFIPKVSILIPAHNEASGIEGTLKAILPQVDSPRRIVVIADNCTDETAAIARQMGTTVLERQDLEHRGKGYALDYGLKFLAQGPPDVVVMIDADCHAEPGTITKIAQLAMVKQRPVQSTYLMETPQNPTPKDSISAFAFLVKNWVRPKGLARLRFPCLLTGTGMAFPWSVIRQVSLASSNLVEDMQLGIDLALSGASPLFCEDAKTLGILPAQETAAKTQRTRWEHGHLNTLLTQVPPLISASFRQQRLDLLAIALDLCVPPLALLVLLWTATLIASIGVAIFNISVFPFYCLAFEGILLLIAILLTWFKFGRSILSLKTLLSIPFYILWKLPMYFGFLKKPQQEWVRTQRDTIPSSEP